MKKTAEDGILDIYVGNIAYAVSEEDLKALFGKFGTVTKVNFLEDNASGQTKGWAFVSMENEAEATKAVEVLNLKEFKGKKLKVNKYRAKPNPYKAQFGKWIPR